MSWQPRKLGEFISIKHGWPFMGEYFSDTGQYILLTPGNAHAAGGIKIRDGKEKFYVGDFPSEYLMKAGDMLVVMTDLLQAAPILGGAIVVPEDDRFLHNQRLGLVELLPCAKMDLRFLYYLLNSPNYRAQVRGTATGATVRHTAPKRICNCTVLIPPTSREQQQVGQFLTAYDDLIAANQRRIALLEDAARRLYREWFVHLRFQDYEAAIASTGLPEGWTKRNLFEICHVDYGFPFDAAQFNTEGAGLPAIRIRDIPEVSTSTFTTQEVDSSYIVKRGDFLIGMDGIFHMNHWVGDDALLVQRVCRIRPKDSLLLAYIGLAMRDPIKRLEKTIQGATVAHLGAKHLKEVELLVPTNLDSSLNTLNQMLWQQIQLREANRKIVVARDLLLPRLMSGQLDVSNIPVPDEVTA